MGLIEKVAEETIGTSLITRVTGGKNGGSSTLTEAGEQAVRDFREMEAKLNRYAEELLNTNRDLFRTEEQGKWRKRKQKQD